MHIKDRLIVVKALIKALKNADSPEEGEIIEDAINKLIEEAMKENWFLMEIKDFKSPEPFNPPPFAPPHKTPWEEIIGPVKTKPYTYKDSTGSKPDPNKWSVEPLDAGGFKVNYND